MKLFKLYEELIQWQNKCLETQASCTALHTSVINFETLYGEIMYKKLTNKNVMPSSCTFVSKKSVCFI